MPLACWYSQYTECKGSRACNLAVTRLSHKILSMPFTPLLDFFPLFVCDSPLFPRNLMIPKERMPGTTANYERLHKRPFGLHCMIQIVRRPGMKHLPERHRTQLRMLHRPFQVLILYLLKQGKIFLTGACESRRKLSRCL